MYCVPATMTRKCNDEDSPLSSGLLRPRRTVMEAPAVSSFRDAPSRVQFRINHRLVFAAAA